MHRLSDGRIKGFEFGMRKKSAFQFTKNVLAIFMPLQIFTKNCSKVFKALNLFNRFSIDKNIRSNTTRSTEVKEKNCQNILHSRYFV